MGQFSWLDCVDGKQILDGYAKTSYVLVPRKFGGGVIEESRYDGYGNFGGYDIYDLVADWNKNYIDPETSGDVPKLEDYCGLWNFEIDNLREQGYTEQQIQEADLAAQNENYQNALRRADNSVNRLIDFCSSKFTDAQMAKKYGRDFKREIGIDIACGDDKNFALPYPIKITYHPDVTYEECNPSPDDPNQGWGIPDELKSDKAWISLYAEFHKDTWNRTAVINSLKQVFKSNGYGIPKVSVRNSEREYQPDSYPEDVNKDIYIEYTGRISADECNDMVDDLYSAIMDNDGSPFDCYVDTE